MAEQKEKYLFKSPQNPDECLEAIYEELSSSKKETMGRQPTVTLKDYVIALLEKTRDIEYNKEIEDKRRELSIKSAIGMLGITAIILVSNGFWVSGESPEWLIKNHYAVGLCGFLLSIVFLGISVERTSLFSILWSYGFTKLIASLSISALLIFCTAKTSDIINGVFGVDSSSFPYSRTILTGIVVFKYASPILIGIAVIAVMHAMIVFFWVRSKITNSESYENLPFNSIVFVILSIFVLGFSTKLIWRDFADDLLPIKAYLMTRDLEFNGNYQCKNIKPGLSVTFLGADQARVLVDVYKVDPLSMEDFIDKNKNMQIEIPRKFYLMQCETM